ncbi:tyrosine-type recombinase/integrase [Chloroflexota bacterium]
MTIDEAIRQYTDYITTIRGYSINTLRSYRRRFAVLSALYGNHQPHTLSYADIEAYCRDGNVSRPVVYRRVAAVKGLFKYLYEHEIISRHLARGLRYPKMGRKLPKVLSNDEVQRLLAAPSEDNPFEHRNKAILYTMYSTGVRRAEVVDIKLSSIDLDACTMHIRGKGTKDRYVFIDEIAKGVLERYVERSRPLILQGRKCPYLFPSRSAKKLPDRSIYEIVNAYAHKARIPKSVHPHMIRHTFATHLYEDSGDLLAVKDLLGHENIITTSVYTHITDKRRRETYDKARAVRAQAQEPARASIVASISFITWESFSWSSWRSF